MTLTVRLDGTLQTALERYCLEAGVSKSHVVQESLAVYLLGPAAPTHGKAARGAAAAARPAPTPAPTPSPNHQAFAAAGLLGGVALGQGADKAAVRARMAVGLARRKG